jgi:hypothetical protein
MQIYKTITDPSTGCGVSWQASQTEASKARGALKKLGHKPETVTVNIPTAKGPLIEWLNENVSA